MDPHALETTRAARRKPSFVAAIVAAALLLSHARVALGAGGDLDETFGAGGITLTNTTGATSSTSDADGISALAVQSDGKVVALGDRGFPGNPTTIDFNLLRYNTDGSLDATFGSGGIVIAAFSTAADHAWDVAVQPDGKIVAVGYTNGTSPASALVVRLNPDGSLDATFGTGGYVTVSYGAGVSSTAYGLALQADGKIVISGDASSGFGVARLLPANGALDPTFGSGGRTIVTPGSRIVVRASDVALQTVSGEQRIVLAGGFQKGNNTDFGLMRLRASGAVDTSFGSGGSVQTVIASGDKIFSVAIDGSNRIVAAGLIAAPKGAKTGTDFGLARYTESGALDATFGSGGKVRTDIAGLDDSPRSLALQSDGKIVVAGNAKSGTYYDLGLVRYTTTGALDTTFGYGGRVQLDMVGRSEFTQAVVTQTVTDPDMTTRERIVTGGTSDTTAGYDKLVAAFEE
jgi:uncharacterized delta-60 repeat protein